MRRRRGSAIAGGLGDLANFHSRTGRTLIFLAPSIAGDINAASDQHFHRSGCNFRGPRSAPRYAGRSITAAGSGHCSRCSRRHRGGRDHRQFEPCLRQRSRLPPQQLARPGVTAGYANAIAAMTIPARGSKRAAEPSVVELGHEAGGEKAAGLICSSSPTSHDTIFPIAGRHIVSSHAERPPGEGRPFHFRGSWCDQLRS